jgi:hypothetical protein
MSDEKQKKPKKEGAKPAKEQAGKPAKVQAPAEKAAKGPKSSRPKEKVVARLAVAYKTTVVPALMKRFQYSNVMRVPRLEKIAINIGVGQATQDPKLVDLAVKDLEAIVGQKVVITRANVRIS